MAHACARAYAHTRTHTHTRTHACMHAHGCISTQIQACAHTHAFAHECTHASGRHRGGSVLHDSRDCCPGAAQERCMHLQPACCCSRTSHLAPHTHLAPGTSHSAVSHHVPHLAPHTLAPHTLLCPTTYRTWHLTLWHLTLCCVPPRSARGGGQCLSGRAAICVYRLASARTGLHVHRQGMGAWARHGCLD